MLTAKERELILKLHRQGKNQQYIAELIGCSQPTVHKWIRLSVKRKSFETLPRSGRPTKLSSQKLADLKEAISREVKAVNENFCSLDTKQLRVIVRREIGIEYSLRHIERIMHRLGFSRITPRPQHLRHDQEKVDEFRDEFKKNLKNNTWVMKL
jgi:transposase